jgi:dihydrofolate reductase
LTAQHADDAKGAPVKHWQDPAGHCIEVVDEVALGRAGISEQRLVEIGQPDSGARLLRHSDILPEYVGQPPSRRQGLMAMITASLFSALDGAVDPGVGNWHFPYFNDEMGSAVGESHDADVMLFGRVTYDSFAGAWPERELAGGEDAAFAKHLGDVRKIVASRSPLDFTWRNSEHLEGDLVEAVTALKNDTGVRRIALSGSVSVVRQLIDAGLLDELHLFLHPATAGSGLRLFEDDGPARAFTLLSCKPFSSGVVYLVYGPDRS